MKYNNIILLFLPFLLLTITITIVNKDTIIKRVIQPETKSMQINLAEAQKPSMIADNLPKDDATFKDVTVKMAKTDATTSSELTKSLATATSTYVRALRMNKKTLNKLRHQCYTRGNWCAREGRGARCRCRGRVRFGLNRFSKWRRVNGSIACNNKVFGDPEKGKRKNCYCEPKNNRLRHRPVRWCAREHSGRPCRCRGYVRYGKNKFTAWKKVNGKIACSNKVFGDPQRGHVKDCYCKSNHKFDRFARYTYNTACKVYTHYRDQNKANRMGNLFRRKRANFKKQFRNNRALQRRR